MFRIYRGSIVVWVVAWSIALLLLAPTAGLAAGERSVAAGEAAELPRSAADQTAGTLPASLPSGADVLSCRLGAGLTLNPITTYNVAQFRLGWYIDWSAAARSASALEYYHVIRVRQGRSGDVYLPSYTISPPLNFSPSGLGPIVQANPGHVWLIGNEPDRVDSQDDTMPDLYAEIYHEAYYFIKGIDPTARVAIGAVLQPTPLRLEYLQRVLATYQAKYGARLPVDVWNTHLYAAREVKDDWGAEIPPGSNAQSGRVYTVHDHLDINVFKALVTELRTWMKANGYQDVPLIITEFGALMPLRFLNANAGYTQDDVNHFLRDAIAYMDSTTDPNLGYAADGYRLVQRAALYSLDDDSKFADGSLRWGSFLLRSSPPYAASETGDYFRNVIAASASPTVDLLPYRVITGPLITGNHPTISPVVRVLVANAGNSAPTIPVTVRFFDITGGQHVQVGSDVAVPAFTGCGTVREAKVVWPNLAPGRHKLAIEIDPGNQIAEVSNANNTMNIEVLVVTHGVYLPFIRR